MKYLFTLEGLKTLEWFCRANPLFAFDFDGTLVGIVDDPAKTHMPNTTASLLQKLNQLGRIAILSGRSLQDLKTCLPFLPAYLAGNHGLESEHSSDAPKELWSSFSRTWRDQLRDLLPSSLLEAGVQVEDKALSLAIHYRRAPHPLHTKSAILKAAGQLHPPPRIVFGKKVVNVLPLGLWHKGTALLVLMQQARIERAIYVGDDDTDEDIFSLGDPRILSVRVGLQDSSAAPFFLRRQSEISRFLRHCIQYVKPTTSSLAPSR